MRFCYHDYDFKGKKLPKQHYFMLNEDEALVWLPVCTSRHTPTRTPTRIAHPHRPPASHASRTTICS